MAERPVVKTRPITRDKLAQFLPSHELIKAFENMSQDVAETLPDAIEGVSEDASSLLAGEVFRRHDAAQPPTMAMPESTERVLSQSMFQPRAQPLSQPPRDDEAGRILSTQIFGA